MTKFRTILIGVIICFGRLAAQQPVLPSPQQILWQDME